MSVLYGDVDASARTDNGDSSNIRRQSVAIPTTSNFRLDINTTGRIDNADVSAARRASVTVLP